MLQETILYYFSPAGGTKKVGERQCWKLLILRLRTELFAKQ